ncbi:ankyrin repeat, SAM and basic leucine zipper domain-containing protein 1 [Maniola hyperantus]|uniref:ankyrin repeat, SAM and basic leucine zipper domain-containing protein 1 n=1 Tax=Aphantopus hyperantus TaxID=2795564 RepID=UPI0015687C59|nr:ankyrin repeat, SAM and basic leucine zipper domain-containing protein 1 [Maniola hyperantus]
MANCRPAGLSDEDSDSDDNYGFFNKLDRNQSYTSNYENTRQKAETKLQEAIINGDLEGTAKVISEDLRDDVNARLESGWTPLSHACFHAQENIVQFFLYKGADPNTHADSVTPIMLACSNTSANESATYNIVLSLIEKNCILNVGDKYGVTPLMRAVISGRISVVELIIDKDVNIEIRDRQGWTAIFWAIHHNQPRCLELLLSRGARWNIVDKSNRSPKEIASSHENDEINDILQQCSMSNESDELLDSDATQQKDCLDNQTQWQDYYPGLRNESKPKYANEISHLLYGMNCDRLSKTFESTPIDLRTFLLLENEDMLKLGIEMPFERQRLKHGLRSFHTRSWKVNAVAGLQTERGEPKSITECLTILGTHLQQLYILETTLTYVLRDYNRIQNQIKFEPPDSPTMERLQGAAKKMIGNINSIRREVNAMKKIHTKISKDSLKPADLITEKSTKDVVIEVFTRIVVIGSLSYVAYRAVNNMWNK